ncbi:MAG: amidophosphoribosyltransferase [Elusimicrobiales bacterium]|nr:amidophosphoribosyltransferase [Elusimicrobiales bacterium]
MCGIFGISDNKDSSKLTYVGLFTLQHRGQESAGMAIDSKNGIQYYNGMGLVSEVFSNDMFQSFRGSSAIGHVRYSTTGSSNVNNAQPLFFNSYLGQTAIAHNGNLTNADALRAKLQKQGAIFQTSTDSEVIIHLMAKYHGRTIEDTIADNLHKLEGAYSFLFLAPGKLIGARDPNGIRTLFLGKLGKSYILSSETCAIEVVGGKVVREVEPGEIVVIEKGKIKFKKFAKAKETARCVFEQVYFARPDSVFSGRTVQSARYDIGRLLAKEIKNVKADIVSGVPDSGTAYALGFSEESGLPYKTVFMRNRYTGRSFIQPDQKLREFTAHLKLAPIRDAIKGKTIILIDDSLVRGTTSKKIIGNLKKAGAKKIIMLIGSPPITNSCYYGIDTPTRKELIATKLKIEGIRKFINADALHYLSLENLIKACGYGKDKDFCTACFTGKYPTKVSKLQTKTVNDK